jgi:hypothetical protein
MDKVRKPSNSKQRFLPSLREIGYCGVDWIDLANDRDRWRGCCEQGNETSDSVKCFEVPE